MGQGPTLDDDDEASALTPLGEFMLRRNVELGPVSYTHLDVYKRQGYGWGGWGGNGGGSGAHG